MRQLLFSLTLIVGLSGTAQARNELDRGTAPASQAVLAAELPPTVVIRIDKNDPSKREVLHSNTQLAAGTQLSSAQFTQMAETDTATGQGRVSELNRDSSTSSWRFYWYPSSSSAYNWYYPTYSYYGYNYGYTPYYGYTSGNYYYAYCGYNNGSTYYPSSYYRSWWY